MSGNRGLRDHLLSLTGKRDVIVTRVTSFSQQIHVFLFSLFTLAFLYVIFYFYFWLVVWNRYDDLNWKLYIRFDKWINWYEILFTLTCVALIYFMLFMCMFLYRILRGRQPYIHPVHVVLSVLTLSACVAVTCYLQEIWKAEWTTTLLSLKMTGPFIQIGCVVLFTVASWFVVSAIYTVVSTALKSLLMVLFVGVLMFLYTMPVYIRSPCVSDKLPPKPKLLAHRGASEILPENTLLAFKTALDGGAWGIESDVQISSDCIPFIMHDRSLARTTNVRSVFPDRAHDDPSTFTIAELKSLNAGRWFLDVNPRRTVADLTQTKREEVSMQVIPTLEEIALLVNNYSGRYFMFDLYGPSTSHPCYNQSVSVTIDAINKTGFPLERLLWLEGTFHGSRPMGVTLVGEFYLPVQTLRQRNIGITNVQYIELTDNNIREYQTSNVSINMWVINSDWFYSFYWCMGISSVTTDRAPHLASLSSPVWHMTPNSYLGLWVTLDVLSAAVIVTVLLIQRRRLSRNYFV